MLLVVVVFVVIASALNSNRSVHEKNRLGDADGGEGGAVLEGILSDRSESLGEGEGGEGREAVEGTLVNGRHSK
jgi:hypothetical protein